MWNSYKIIFLFYIINGAGGLVSLYAAILTGIVWSLLTWTSPEQ